MKKLKFTLSDLIFRKFSAFYLDICAYATHRDHGYRQIFNPTNIRHSHIHREGENESLSGER